MRNKGIIMCVALIAASLGAAIFFRKKEKLAVTRTIRPVIQEPDKPNVVGNLPLSFLNTQVDSGKIDKHYIL